MIRSATDDDVEEIARPYERSFAALDYLSVLHTLDEHRYWFGRQLAENEGCVWDEGRVRGFSVLTEAELMYLISTSGGHVDGDRRGAAPSSDVDDQLATNFAGRELPDGIGNVGQRVRPLDRGGDLSRHGELREAVETGVVLLVQDRGHPLGDER